MRGLEIQMACLLLISYWVELLPLVEKEALYDN